MTDPKKSRGFRNKNPGNIDYNPANKWQGQVGIERFVPRPRFAEFASHELGVRALTVLLTTYYDKHGLDTVRKIIGRWAPSNENDTSAYVNTVAAAVGVRPDDRINLHHYPTMRPLVEAIITHENGGDPYKGTRVVEDGMRQAGIYDIADTVTKTVATKTGTAAVTVASVTSAAAVVQPFISSMAGLPQWTGVALIVVAALLAAGYFLVQRFGK